MRPTQLPLQLIIPACLASSQPRRLNSYREIAQHVQLEPAARRGRGSAGDDDFSRGCRLTDCLLAARRRAEPSLRAYDGRLCRLTLTARCPVNRPPGDSRAGGGRHTLMLRVDRGNSRRYAKSATPRVAPGWTRSRPTERERVENDRRLAGD